MAHVLIIEDDPTIRKLYAAILKQRNYSVAEAETCEEGLKNLEGIRPDLIILDILMPGIDGIAFLEKADVLHNYPGTKVLAASNMQTPELTLELERLKVDRYILKAEYTPAMLGDLVHDLITPVK
jgi:CheY-like chemotaxis protein